MAGQVTLTDFQPAVIANLRYNAALLGDSSLAAVASVASTLPPGHRVQVEALDWEADSGQPDLYHVIIGTDIVCSDSDGRAAAGAVARHLAPQGRGYFLLPPAKVRYGVAAFTLACEERGLVVRTEPVSLEDVKVEEEAVGGGYEESLLLHSVVWPDREQM